MGVLHGPRVERRRVIIDGSAFWGAMREDGALALDDGRVVDPASLVHLPPCEPTKIIGVHITYSSRSMETRDKPVPTENPTYFMKPTTALNGHNGQIVKYEGTQYLNYEGEYAAIIGKVTRNVTPDEAWDHIAGF